ncbi:MAG TPA: HEAT repeat domain-containing protein [Planctomycetota bacterium]|nr:HEAT repeat domain-containing protein [Planctomycetota bacterium]
MRIALLLALFAFPQEDVESLLRQLGDESIEVRERAAGALLKMGEKTRPALEKSAKSESAIVRTHVASILKALDRIRRTRVSATLVSVSGEMTLKEAIASIQEQGGRPVACDSWPEGKFKIDLKGVPYWKAIEEACRASGKRSLVCDVTGPKLVGDRFEAIPSVNSGSFRLQLAGVAERRTMNLDNGAEDKSFVVRLALGYENSTPPVRIYIALDSAMDDLGNELAAEFKKHIIFAPRYEQISSPKNKPPSALALELKSSVAPKPEAQRIARLAGTVTAYVAASDENISVPISDGWEPALEILEDGVADPVVGTAQFRFARRAGTDLRCDVNFKSFDNRLLCTLSDLWTVRGEGDKTATGWSSAVAENGPGDCRLSLEFKDAGSVGKVLAVEVPIPRRLIRKEIPFELKDIRIR